MIRTTVGCIRLQEDLMNEPKKRILVTGGTGRIGVHLVNALAKQGFIVRVVSTTEPVRQPAIEWSRMDWLDSLNFDGVVDGCTAVMHLGAETFDVRKMKRVNEDATQALVKAAERAHVAFFCYVSSVCVYGSPRSRIVTEESPVVTADRDLDGEYWADDQLRAYARTKVGGERRLIVEAKDGEYVVFRPTVVCTIDDILAIKDQSLLRKIFLARRYSNQVFVDDVVGALIWFLQRALNRGEPKPGVTIYNLSDDDMESNTFGHFLDKAYRDTGRKEFYCPFQAPRMLDIAKDMLKYRSLDVRYRLGRFRLSAQKLFSTGYRHAVGMRKARNLAISQLLGAGNSGPAKKTD